MLLGPRQSSTSTWAVWSMKTSMFHDLFQHFPWWTHPFVVVHPSFSWFFRSTFHDFSQHFSCFTQFFSWLKQLFSWFRQHFSWWKRLFFRPSIQPSSEVRRFVKFLDLLYDRRRQLQISCAASLEELFEEIRQEASRGSGGWWSFPLTMINSDMTMGQNLWYHIWVDEHPFTSYFDVHQGYRVLTHNHIYNSN